MKRSRTPRPLFDEGQAHVVRLQRLLGLIEDAGIDRTPGPDIPTIPVARHPGPTFKEMMAVVNRRKRPTP